MHATKKDVTLRSLQTQLASIQTTLALRTGSNGDWSVQSHHSLSRGFTHGCSAPVVEHVAHRLLRQCRMTMRPRRSIRNPWQHHVHHHTRRPLPGKPARQPIESSSNTFVYVLMILKRPSVERKMRKNVMQSCIWRLPDCVVFSERTICFTCAIPEGWHAGSRIDITLEFLSGSVLRRAFLMEFAQAR